MPGKRYDRQFKLSASALILDGKVSVKELSEQLDVPDNTLRRWASEYEKNGEDAFPGKGKPIPNKDYEILRLRKENEELRRENDLLKKFRAFLRQSSL